MGDVEVAAGAGAGPGADGAGGAGGAGQKGKNGKKKKDKMECGESGSYGDLKKKTGQGEFDRDHVPSKAALKERAAHPDVSGGRELCPLQKKAIDNLGNAIAIPKAVHSGFSPTYGGNNSEARITSDAGNLQTAAQRDTADVSEGMKKSGSKECKKKYDDWAKKVNAITPAQYDEMLKKAIDPLK